MLSDQDLQALRELQRGLSIEDPGFVASFDAVGPRDSTYSVQWAYDLPRWAYMIAMAVAMGLMVAMLTLSLPAGALLFAVPAIVTSVLWCHRDDDRQSP